jgi:Amt family ammonium transporter
LQSDREHSPPNNLLIAMAGAGILWLGWDGFNGGDPYFANADAGGAVLNTNIATAAALLVWVIMDSTFLGKPSMVGAINGMIAGLVAITPAAGYVNGYGAIIIGVAAGIIPWLSMNVLQKTKLMLKVDDTLSVFSTHAVAGVLGGLLTGVLADPNMLVYIGTGSNAPGVNATGWYYGNFKQFVLQGEAALFIIVLNAVGTFILLKLISIVVPLRMDEKTLQIGDAAVHGEEAYAPH